MVEITEKERIEHEELRKIKHTLLENWNILKEEFNFINDKDAKLVRAGEIWWVGIGENVGVEINGKSSLYSRPVLVLKKLSRYGFMGVPITSQRHAGSWYVSFKFQNKIQTAVLAQARVYSVNRIYNRLGQVPDTDLEKIRDGFLKLYSK